MADSVFELIVPHFLQASGGQLPVPALHDGTTRTYIDRLTTLSLDTLNGGEEHAIRQSAQSTARSIQGLSKRSYRSIIAASDDLSNLTTQLPALDTTSSSLRNVLPDVEAATALFAAKYERSHDSAIIRKRQQLLQLNNNVDRLGNILELPALLSSIVSGSSTASTAASSGASASGYASALDIHAQVKRLTALYPNSELVKHIGRQSHDAIQSLITVLIASLDSPGLKLAAAMRAIGWLRRITPDMVRTVAVAPTGGSHSLGDYHEADEMLGAIFLTCRLGTLRRTLTALEPLKDLADTETRKRTTQSTIPLQWSDGTQTERYLKRYIEVFREHSFAIISTYKSLFPDSLAVPNEETEQGQNRMVSSTQHSSTRRIGSQPSVLATFVPQVIDMLTTTLRAYMPNMTDTSARESLLTQVLYCAASLGRLGADFTSSLALLEDDLCSRISTKARVDSEREWIRVQKKHRAQASRLELLASGVPSASRLVILSQ